jgi:purine-binding chemotaxis protein CheW
VERDIFLIIRVGAQVCALPLEHVEETMRPRPVRALAGVPHYVSGVALIRGNTVPVVDARVVLGERPVLPPTRFVTLRVAHRRVALGVDRVVALREIDASHTADLPPLLEHATEDVVSSMGILDAELLFVLRAGRLVPEPAWTVIEGGARE